METVRDFIFLGSKIIVDGDCSHDIERCLLLRRKAVTNIQHAKKQTRHFASNVCVVKAMVFPVAIYTCENWTIKKAEHQRTDAFKLWFQTVVLEKTLESLLDCKEIQPVHLKGDQSWVFIGRIDAKAEAPILWPPDVKN